MSSSGRSILGNLIPLTTRALDPPGVDVVNCTLFAFLGQNLMENGKKTTTTEFTTESGIY